MRAQGLGRLGGSPARNVYVYPPSLRVRKQLCNVTSGFSGGVTEPFQPDLPLRPRPPPNTSFPDLLPRPDFFATFGPEKGDFRSESGRDLRGPVAILFISRDTCSDSIAKLFRACFCGGIAQLSRDTLQNGVSHRYVCVKLSTKGGYRTILGGVLTSLKKYRAIWGIAAIVSQYGAIWGH